MHGASFVSDRLAGATASIRVFDYKAAPTTVNAAGPQKRGSLCAKSEFPECVRCAILAPHHGTLRDEDDFSGGARFEDFFVGASGFGQRKLFANDGA